MWEANEVASRMSTNSSTRSVTNAPTDISRSVGLHDVVGVLADGDGIMSDEDDDLTVEEWLHREMKKMLQELVFLEISYETHQIFWGVPCGPTLSMVEPPQPCGSLGIQHNEPPYTAEQEAAMWNRVSNNLVFMDTDKNKNGEHS